MRRSVFSFQVCPEYSPLSVFLRSRFSSAYIFSLTYFLRYSFQLDLLNLLLLLHVGSKCTDTVDLNQTCRIVKQRILYMWANNYFPVML
jgi:hypothetical protein